MGLAGKISLSWAFVAPELKYPANPVIHYKLNQQIERVQSDSSRCCRVLMCKRLLVCAAATFNEKPPAGAAAVTRASQSWMPPSLSI